MEEQASALALASNGSGAAIAQHNTAAVAVAEKARATVQARYLVALHRPRDWDVVRQRILKDCARPVFAAVGRFAKPVGKEKGKDGAWRDKHVTGPSIRFVEAAIRHMGNIDQATQVTYEDDAKRIVNVTVTDLETNATYGLDIIVSKTVERRKLRNGQEALGTRTNSYGDQVYIVEASEDDLVTKQAALVSKAVRTLGMRIIPGDLVEEAERAMLNTIANEDKRDPDAARKAVVDSFFGLGVGADQLKAYLRHPIESSAPHELGALRELYAAIRSGETTWSEVMENREEQAAEADAPKTASLREKVKKTAERAKSTPDYIAAARDAETLYAIVGAPENRAWILANAEAARAVLEAATARTGADSRRIEVLLEEQGS